MKTLRVGTDCSGIEAPIQALKQLKIPFKHVFSSEIDKYCIESIKANYDPEIIFGDIAKRDIRDVPNIDLYICGFPCQPFSSAGKRRGLKDKRGSVFYSCIEVIENKQPKYFILENVKGILGNDGGKTWKIIEEELLELEKYGYVIKWKILNTKDYGIPQNRERLFIVGCKNKDFEWPKKIKIKPIKTYIDYKDKNKYETNRKYFSKILKTIPSGSVFIDNNFLKLNKFVDSDKWSPCLNTQNGLWNVPIGRYANIKERLRLQGFPITFKQVVSDTQMNKQIGNSMSVNVLKAIFKEIF